MQEVMGFNKFSLRDCLAFVNPLASDGKWASFLGTGTSGHGVCGHGQARAMPLFQLLGMGTNLRA